MFALRGTAGAGRSRRRSPCRDTRSQAKTPRPRNATIESLRLRWRQLQTASPTTLRSGDVTSGTLVPLAVNATDDPLKMLAPPQAPDEIGRLGSYRVLKLLGAGGMGLVFLAEDIALKRRVALKLMRLALAHDPEARTRFLREAQAMAALNHDHIVAVHQVGMEGEVPFMVMPLLDGEMLEQRLKRDGALPIAEVIRIGREIALGLAAAHEHGLIHRDIKPANLWLEAPFGRVKILDFGLARAVAPDGQLTNPGAMLGTPAYMAPEQMEGEAEPRSDLFSLGSVLYRLSTGHVPFPGTKVIEIMRNTLWHEPKPPHQLNAAVPHRLSDVIVRLLAKERARLRRGPSSRNWMPSTTRRSQRGSARCRRRSFPKRRRGRDPARAPGGSRPSRR